MCVTLFYTLVFGVVVMMVVRVRCVCMCVCVCVCVRVRCVCDVTKIVDTSKSESKSHLSDW